MGNFIFFTNQYLPKPGATGLCVHEIAKALAEENEVFTIAYQAKEQERVYDGVRIVPIKAPIFISKPMIKTKSKRVFLQLLSIISRCIHITKYPFRSSILVKKYIDGAKSLIDEWGGKAIIVASYTPLEAVVAALKLKRMYGDSIKVVFYSLDTLSKEEGNDGILSKEFRTKLGIKWETKFFSECDLSLIMECHEDHYRELYSSFFKNKIQVVNFPLLVQKNHHKLKGDLPIKNGIRFVYTGAIYKNLRNPQYLLYLLENLSKEMNIEVFFLGCCDCEDILYSSEKTSNGTIRYMGMQSHEVAEKYILSADVLLSIGNADSPMAPSKIYEYMSTGKPIIHTYTYKKDPCIMPLRKYSNALLLNEKECVDLNTIKKFINKRETLDFSHVEKLFCTSIPKYTAKIIEQV